MGYLGVSGPGSGKTTAAFTFSFATLSDRLKCCCLLGGTDKAMADSLNEKDVHNYKPTLLTHLCKQFDRSGLVKGSEFGDVLQFKWGDAKHDQLRYFEFVNGAYVLGGQVNVHNSDDYLLAAVDDDQRIVTGGKAAGLVKSKKTQFFGFCRQTDQGFDVAEFHCFFDIKAVIDGNTVEFDGFPYIRVNESAVMPPFEFLFPKRNKKGLVCACASHKQHVTYYDDGQIVVRPLEPLSVLLQTSRCFIDAVSVMFYTEGGNGMEGGISSGFLKALEASTVSECILFYAPIRSDLRDEPLNRYDFSGLLCGKIYVAGGSDGFLGSSSWFATTRDRAVNDRQRVYILVDSQKGLVYGNRQVYNYRNGSVMSYEEVGLSSRFDPKLVVADKTALRPLDSVNEAKKKVDAGSSPKRSTHMTTVGALKSLYDRS